MHYLRPRRYLGGIFAILHCLTAARYAWSAAKIYTEAQWWLAAHQHLEREAPVLGALRLDGVEVEHELREADGSTAASVVHGAESRDARFVAWASEPPTHRRTPPHTCGMVGAAPPSVASSLVSTFTVHIHEV